MFFSPSVFSLLLVQKKISCGTFVEHASSIGALELHAAWVVLDDTQLLIGRIALRCFIDNLPLPCIASQDIEKAMELEPGNTEFLFTAVSGSGQKRDKTRPPQQKNHFLPPPPSELDRLTELSNL